MEKENVIKEFEKICEYTLRPHEFRVLNDVLSLLKEQEVVKAEEAEMYILHNDGTVEYIKDIDSIMLLASKDYGITYCGTFAEGR